MNTAWVLAPASLLGGGAVLVYAIARLITQRNRVLATSTAILYALALLATAVLYGHLIERRAVTWMPAGAEGAVFQADPAALLVVTVAASLGGLVAIYSGRYLALDHRYEHYYPLLLLLTGGVIAMVMAVDLFTLYLCTALTSAASYVLVAFRRQTETAIEAGFKYAIMGSMGSIMILAGIGFLFRETGSLQLPYAPKVLREWGILGSALLLFGYVVKAAVFPAHTWLPDAHGRAPSSISAMLSGIIVESYLFVMVKTGLALGLDRELLGWLLVGLATGSMIVGNLMALRQTYGKRLLGYSSIAQVGYMLASLGLGVAYSRAEPIAAGLFLLVAHAAMKGLAFLAKGIFHYYCGATMISDLRGISHRVPIAAGCFCVAIAGLIGVPPLAGFMAKLHLLLGAVHVGEAGAYWVVALLMLNSLLSLGYYLPLIGHVLAREDDPLDRCAVSPWMRLPVIALGSIVLLLGILPGIVFTEAQRAAEYLLRWGQ